LSTSRFGIQASLSISLNYTIHDNYEYAGDEMKGIVRQGDNQPVTDINIYGNTNVNRRFSIFLRPEIGVFYRLNSRGRVSVDAMWGINPRGPLVTRDFHEIIYEGQSYENLHK
jgi:hypothetical protein